MLITVNFKFRSTSGSPDNLKFFWFSRKHDWKHFHRRPSLGFPSSQHVSLSQYPESEYSSHLSGIVGTLGSLEPKGSEPVYCLSCCINVNNSIIDPRQIFLQFKPNLYDKFDKFTQLLLFRGKSVLSFLVQFQF